MGASCTNCSGYNHFAVKCSGNSRFSRESRQVAPPSREYRQPRSFEDRRPSHKPRRYGHPRGHKVHELHDSSDSSEDLLTVSESVNVAEDANSMYKRKLFATLRCGRPAKAIRFQLDSGATVNVIPCGLYKQIFADPEMKHVEKTQTTLNMYNGSEMTTVGSRGVRVTNPKNHRHYKVRFLIVDTQCQPLLGSRAIQAMELVKVMTWNIDSGPAMNDRAQKDVNRDVSTIAQPSSDLNIATTDLLDKYADVFEGLGKFNGQLHLQLDEAVPPVQLPARRLPIAVRDNVKAEIGRLVQEGVLAPVNEPTEWVSAMVVVKKANGSVRLCIDPKPLNKALKRNHYHLRTIDDVLPELAGKKYFSVVDVKSGFWHVELDESSSYLTTMATPFGKYRWTRMPFGISPSPEEFARRLHDEIQGLPGVVSIADDILVFGDNGEDHDRHLEGLLQRCRDRNIILNRDKAVIRKDRVNYMGFVLTSEGCQPDPDKIAAIKDMPAPTDKKGVQRLLGMVNFVSRFAHLSQVCAPLRDLIKDEIHFQWDPHIHGRCFNTIKDILSTAPALKYFDSTKPTTLQCDSSERGLGACLMQGDHPIAYSSRALTPTEQHYAQIEKELLSVCFGVEKFQQFVYGRKTTIETDHKPLEIIWKKSMTSAPKRLQRMLLRLQHFDLDIVYKKGEHMYMADTLSRAYLPLPTSSAPDMTDHVLAMSDVDTAEEANIISFVAVSDARKAAIREATCADSEMIALKKTIKQGWPETPGALPEMVRPYFNFRDELAVADEFILKGDRLVIPASHRQSIMDKLHYGHTGIQACTRRAREVVFW